MSSLSARAWRDISGSVRGTGETDMKRDSNSLSPSTSVSLVTSVHISSLLQVCRLEAVDQCVEVSGDNFTGAYYNAWPISVHVAGYKLDLMRFSIE